MEKKDWHHWVDKKDNPPFGRDIILRKKNSEVVLARYIGLSRLAIFRLMIDDNEEIITAHIEINFFSEGDEWIYPEQLK